MSSVMCFSDATIFSGFQFSYIPFLFCLGFFTSLSHLFIANVWAVYCYWFSFTIQLLRKYWFKVCLTNFCLMQRQPHCTIYEMRTGSTIEVIEFRLLTKTVHFFGVCVCVCGATQNRTCYSYDCYRYNVKKKLFDA